MCVALCLVALAAPATARADRLDGELVKMSAALIDRAKEEKAKTVGVLKFRAARDDGPEDFHLGPINNVLADRLETTLILGYNTNPDWPIDVVRDATAEAARKGLSYLPAEKAAALFDLQYPLAAGGKRVTPDLFLTGIVRFDTNRHTTTVTIQSLTREHPRLREVARFTVPTERSTVAEAGRSFTISRSLAERDAGPDKDEAKDDAGAAAEEAAEQPQPPKEATPGVRPAATPESPVDVRVLYNDQDVPLTPEARDPGGRAFARDPKEGDTVKVVLVNRGRERVAVALLVNGFNTIMQEMAEPRYCMKWILGPGKDLVVEGFYVGGTGKDNVRPFRVLSDQASEALFEINDGDLRNERLGTIGVHVFVEGARPAGGDTPVTRGLSPLVLKEKAAQIKGIGDFNKLLYAAADRDKQDRTRTRGLIADDGKAQNGSRLVEEEFKNATEVQHLLIRYYDRKK
jgi:hypothetical protein